MSDLLKQAAEPQSQSYRIIPLTKNQFAIVDVEDYEWLSRYKWQAYWHPRTRSYYARCGIYDPKIRKNRTFSMHRMILQAKPGELLDHWDRDTLNNRRGNLRLATPGQNAQNKGATVLNKVGIKGVHRDRVSRRWMAQIQVDGRKINLGAYDTAEDAGRSYDLAANKHFGEFAVLNFPDRLSDPPPKLSVLARDNTSGFRGVAFNKKSRKWVAYICVASKRMHLGYFPTASSAARSYDEAAHKFLGDRARLNFPKL